MKKILELSEATKYLGNLKNKKVLVGGCFDVLHVGHIRFLTSAKKQGDILIVTLESDQYIHKFKKRIPVHSQRERAEIVAALQAVDYVVLLPLLKNDHDYFRLVEDIRPHVIAISEGDSQIQNKKLQAVRVGAIVKEVTPIIKPFSSSYIMSYETFSRDRSSK